ncbi:MAG: acyl-[acyl-carrier-protein]--UDP-N-acetylglucosamine O-acyltransferase [Planctomycetaceae bacterium]|nr:MAG: acyl-[acyl-carrier-protein]--UDP-N-acetylglucosamine O-acyltransferase [Planctomycetaceae bacterium]
MPVYISTLSEVHPRAEIADDVVIGPFCVIGPHVKIGRGCRLDSHVTIVGHTEIGARNRFWPGCVIGAEPQDYAYKDADTRTIIGNDNQIREGVTIHRGADKEDGVTRVGNGCLLMANCHVAHNCRVYDHVILVNGVLLGGHVHVHDYAIVSGNTVVHHYASIGTSAFISGGCRVATDVPPYMMAAGSDNPQVVTINLVGMQRRGIPAATIGLIRQAYKRLYREHRPISEVRRMFEHELSGKLPAELVHLIEFVERTGKGKQGRAREIFRHTGNQATASSCTEDDPEEQSRNLRRRAA